MKGGAFVSEDLDGSGSLDFAGDEPADEDEALATCTVGSERIAWDGTLRLSRSKGRNMLDKWH